MGGWSAEPAGGGGVGVDCGVRLLDRWRDPTAAKDRLGKWADENSMAWLFVRLVFFFSSRRRHTRFDCDWSSDVCSSDLGDVAVVPEPGYAVYEGGTVLAGGEPYRCALTPRSAFLLELEQLPPEVVRRTRLVYLNYPNNPTAAVATHEYLERTVAFCRRHDIVIAYDNPYCEITYDGYVAPSIFETPGAWGCRVQFHSPSKTFCMTGWRLGWAAGRPELIAALGRVKNYVDTGAFPPAQTAGPAALPQAEQLAREYVAPVRERRGAMLPVLRVP